MVVELLGLNPCSNGIDLDQIMADKKIGTGTVLILVLME